MDISIIGDEAVGRRKLRLQDRGVIEMPNRPPTQDEPEIDVYPSDHHGHSAMLTRPIP